MECGLLGCGKYTIIGVGIGAVIGATVYFLLPDRKRSFAPHSSPPVLPEPEASVAGLGCACAGLKRRLSRRW